MFPDFWLPHMGAGMCYHLRAQFSDAREYQKTESMNPESTFAVTGEGMSLARAGKKAEAYRAIDRLKAMSRDVYVSPSYLALIYQVSETRKRSSPGTTRPMTIAPYGCSGSISIRCTMASAKVLVLSRW